MIGTYNEPYTGDLHTPEQLFQSIPQAVSPRQVIYAANGITERLTGMMGLFTTNDQALNGEDMERALFGLEAMLDQLRVVLKHPTTDDRHNTAPVRTSTSGAPLELIGLNETATNKILAIMSYVETEQGGDVAVLGADLEQLGMFIDDVDKTALLLWKCKTCHAEFSQPEDYLLCGLPMFDGVPYDLIKTMLARAKAVIEALTNSIQSPVNRLDLNATHDLLWDIRSLLGMVNTVLHCVDLEGKA